MAKRAHQRKGSGRGAAERAGPRKVSARRLPARTSSAREEKRDVELVRLNKYLADHGVASRRASDQLIVAGKVTIDGEPITELGTKVDPALQKVEVDGFILRPEGSARRYYLLNKPSGVVCTNERRETRPRAIDLITDRDAGRIYTVGRLDEESTGLILLTNDGEFALHVAHPRYGVPKTYRVKLQGRITDEAVQKVRQGIYLSEGRTGGARILVKRRTPKVSTLAVTLREGRNREVRRIFARVGYKVLGLERTDIGPLNSRGLGSGKWRALSREEVESLLHDSVRADSRLRPDADIEEADRPPGRSTGRRIGRGAGRATGARRAGARRGGPRRSGARRGAGARRGTSARRGGTRRGGGGRRR
ncbi:MAG: pseudouridine synthase [Planctomycetota bacterium]